MHNDPTPWLQSSLGQRVYGLERKLVSEALAQVFGWQLLQVGAWGDDQGLIAEARTQYKAVVAEHPHSTSVMRSRTDALALASDSVDAILLPHTLEYQPDPHEILREVSRVLAAQGHLIVLGFCPMSAWGVRHAFARTGFPPGIERMIAERRIKDWLKLLGFEVIDSRRYLFTWPWGPAEPRAQRILEKVGERVWPLLAGAYLIKARKRVYCVTPVRPRWRTPARVLGGLIEPTTRNPS
jgi:SAM-dependent methyltransferase